MNALSKNGVPVPPLLGLCEDSNVLGTPFYVMEFVAGNIYKVRLDCEFHHFT